ncbi:MAG: M3 family metallopeptidase [Pseudomonadota bacterium]
MTDNPLLQPFDGPFGLPPFERIEPQHFEPAFEAAMVEHLAEIEAIKANPAPADAENTLVALERCGKTLDRTAAVFFNLCASHTSPALQEVERAVVPKLAAHNSKMMLDSDLFARIAAVPEEGLGAEEARVRYLMLRNMRKSGAELDEAGRTRMAEIKVRGATLGTNFGQNILKDEAEWVMWLEEGDLDGLPDALRATAKAEATRRDAPDHWAITLSRSSVEPFLAFSARRDLREVAFRAWTGRGDHDNWPLIAEMLALRHERAKLLGFESFAAMRLADQMAKTPDAVSAFLRRVWAPARAKAQEERAALADLAASEGANIEIEPWDWRYYSEKERRRAYDVDEAETKPYLALESVIDAAFDVASRLFGLQFEAKPGLTLHHPQARAWEVKRADGSHLGLFIGDYFARPTKRSGAWASTFRGQQKLTEPHRPIVINTCNFAQGDPALLTFDDARTLFHEFGHALHSLMSDVTYPSIAGTAVSRDFVELPSQLYEHWLSVPEILADHARHVETGHPMPADLVERLKAAATFNQGFATVEYLASAIVDLEMHRAVPNAAGMASDDPQRFQAAVLTEIGMPTAIAMRHASQHFQHVFSGEGYSAGYYSYLWAEVMDADAFEAFEATGDPFDPALAGRLAEHILSAGGKQEPEDAYTAFRGAMPDIEPLLKGRGLLEEPA